VKIKEKGVVSKGGNHGGGPGVKNAKLVIAGYMVVWWSWVWGGPTPTTINGKTGGGTHHRKGREKKMAQIRVPPIPTLWGAGGGGQKKKTEDTKGGEQKGVPTNGTYPVI